MNNQTIHSTAPQPVNPSYPMSVPDLSGGQKFGWLALGFLSGVTGILIAWLVNSDKASTRGSSVKYAVIGLAINVVLLFFVYSALLLPVLAAIR